MFHVKQLRRPDDDAPVWFLAEALGLNSVNRGDRIVDDLPLGRGHGLELVVLARGNHALRRRLHDRNQLIAMPGPVAVDVEQQPDPPFRLSKNRDTGELLKGIQRLPVGTDEYIEVGAFEVDVATGFVDPGRDVAIDIEGVQQPLKEVARPLGVCLHHLGFDGLVAIGTSGSRRAR